MAMSPLSGLSNVEGFLISGIGLSVKYFLQELTSSSQQYKPRKNILLSITKSKYYYIATLRKPGMS